MIPRATPEMEVEANYFAMHLLVPTDALRREMDKIGGIDLSSDDGSLKKLAKKFGVSQAVIAFRIGEEAGL
jgi:Zn-dependent peptidase ImmA (M78 family)